MARLTMVDLFAGCGGITAGFTATGHFVPIAAVELDAHAAATYAHNFGEHVHVGDVSEWVDGDLPRADVVVGGPPCQGFSQLGKQDPDDPRSRMWEHYVTALTKIEPQYFVIENVPQFLKFPQYEALVRETARGGRLAGYRLDAFVLNAADFGAAQNRRRAVVIGSPAGGEPVDVYPAMSAPKTVREAFDGLEIDVHETQLPASTTTVNGMTVPGPFKLADIHITRNPTELSRQRYAAIPPGGNRHDLPDELQAPCWRKHRSGAGDVMGRLHVDRPSVTIRTEFFKPEKGRYLHPTADRPITHAEAARLQGFPDTFEWCGTKLSIAKQIGNAVPPPLASAIAAVLIDHRRA